MKVCGAGITTVWITSLTEIISSARFVTAGGCKSVLVYGNASDVKNAFTNSLRAFGNVSHSTLSYVTKNLSLKPWVGASLRLNLMMDRGLQRSQQ